MRILMIGGSSFMGPAVAGELVGLGHEVTIFHRGKTENDVPDAVRHIHGDQGDLPSYTEAFADVAPEVVIHMMLMTEAQARTFVEVFTQPPLNQSVKRAVVISSQDVYRAYGRVNQTEPGPSDPTPLNEDAPLREQLYPHKDIPTPPGREEDDFMRLRKEYDKILVERVVMSARGLSCTVLRLPAVYGPRDGQHRMRSVVKRVDDGRRALIVPADMANWRWTHGYVDDVAHAIALAATTDKAAGRIYNVGESEALPWVEFTREIGRAAGWDGEVVIVPTDKLPPSLQSGIDASQDLVTDSSRIRAALGYAEALPRAERLARAVAWEHAHPLTGDAASEVFDYAAEDSVLAGE